MQIPPKRDQKTFSEYCSQNSDRDHQTIRHFWPKTLQKDPLPSNIRPQKVHGCFYRRLKKDQGRRQRNLRPVRNRDSCG